MSDSIGRLNAALEDRYVVERELGEGGMATVYLAKDLKHNRSVALKVLKPELAAVVGGDRFLSEIETTANLHHPHILPLFDSGEAGGFLFYVMPYVEDETLRARLDREKQLPVGEAVRIATAVANALQHAHARGVIHRDIKPGNILMQDGEPVVSDFGIALAVGSAGGARLTETGLSVGTPFYMSPEQATGDQQVGPSTDIYALAAVLYEMLVGDPPYTGSTAQAVLGKIIQGSPTSATAIRKAVPPHVDAALRKGLEKLPADRFSEAQDFAKALSDPGFRHGEAELVAAVAGSGRWRPLALAFGATTMALAGALAWVATRPAPATEVERFSIDFANVGASNFALVPDGSAVVVLAPVLGGEVSSGQEGGEPQLVIRRWKDLAPVPIPGTADGFSPTVSPSGDEVAFLTARGQLKVAPIAGGLVRTVADSVACCVRWGVDGFIYYRVLPARGIGRVPASGGSVEAVTTRTDTGDGVHGSFHVLPTRAAGLFTVWGSDGLDRIEAIRLDTGERTVVTEGMGSYLTDSGHLLFGSADGEVLAAPFDSETLELTAPPVPVVEDVFVSPFRQPAFVVAPDGTLLYQRGPALANEGEWEFVWVSRSGDVTPVAPGESFSISGGNRGWRLSPDGRHIAFMRTEEGNTDIWTKELPDGPVSRLTFAATRDMLPYWSPDGRYVTYTSIEEPFPEEIVPQLWSRRADGTGTAEPLVEGFGTAKGFWSPDGEWLILRSAGLDQVGAEAARGIYAYRPGVDSVPRPLMVTEQFWEQGPALSPDGRWIAYVSNETGRQEIFVRPFPGVESGKWQVSSAGGVNPVWARNGPELFFYGTETNELMVAEFSTSEGSFRRGSVSTVFRTPAGVYTAVTGNQEFYDVAPDGDRFLMVRQTDSDDSDRRLVLIQNFGEELSRLAPGGASR